MPSSSGAFSSFRVASFSRSRRPSRAARWYLSFMAHRQLAPLAAIPFGRRRHRRRHRRWTRRLVRAIPPQGRRSASLVSRDVCSGTGGEAVLLVAEGGNTVRDGAPPDLPITPAQSSCEPRRPRRIIACARAHARMITC